MIALLLSLALVAAPPAEVQTARAAFAAVAGPEAPARVVRYGDRWGASWDGTRGALTLPDERRLAVLGHPDRQWAVAFLAGHEGGHAWLERHADVPLGPGELEVTCDALSVGELARDPAFVAWLRGSPSMARVAAQWLRGPGAEGVEPVRLRALKALLDRVRSGRACRAAVGAAAPTLGWADDSVVGARALQLCRR